MRWGGIFIRGLKLKEIRGETEGCFGGFLWRGLIGCYRIRNCLFDFDYHAAFVFTFRKFS